MKLDVLCQNRRRLTIAALGMLGTACGHDISGPRAAGTARLTVAAVAPSTVRALVLTVSGAGIPNPIVGNFPIDSTGGTYTAHGSLEVPAGSARHLRMEALDAGGIVTHRADTTMDLPAGTVALSLVMKPLDSQVQVNVSFAARGAISILRATALPGSVGDTITWSVSATDANGGAVPGDSVVWSSSDPTVLESIGAGRYVAHRAGMGQIEARFGAVQAVDSASVGAPAPPWTTVVGYATAPHGATTAFTAAPGDGAVYALLGGGDFTDASVWRFDLASDAWTQVAASSFPIGKYRKLIHDPVSHRLLTYWDGIGPVYFVPESGGAWASNDSAGPASDSYYGGAAFWNGSSGALDAFGGYGGFNWHNIAQEFDTGSQSWVQLAVAGSSPAPRFSVSQSSDDSTRTLYLAGGQGNPSGNQADGVVIFNDVWKLDMTSSTWTQILPQSASGDSAYTAGIAVAEPLHRLFRFGGTVGLDQTRVLTGLVQLDLDSPSSGWVALRASGTEPSARSLPFLFYDAPRHRLLIFGGLVPGQPDMALDVYALAL